MKNFLHSLIPAVMLMIAGTQTPASAQDGFTNLFNGKDFDGWYLKIRSGGEAVANQVFTISKDGWVHVFADPFQDGHKLDTDENDTHGLMYTKKSYSRYIFRFEYKWGKKRLNNFKAFQYDAGMYYHVYDDKIWPGGIEYQVRYNHLLDKNHTGDFWAAGKCRFQWTADAPKGHYLPPSAGGQAQPVRQGEHLAREGAKFHGLDDEWNQCEVVVMGDKYAIHKLNGQIVNVGTDLNVSEGRLGLQSETAEIFYRNIRIKEFDKDIPIGEFMDKNDGDPGK